MTAREKILINVVGHWKSPQKLKRVAKSCHSLIHLTEKNTLNCEVNCKCDFESVELFKVRARYEFPNFLALSIFPRCVSSMA